MDPVLDVGALVAAAALLANQLIEIVKALVLSRIQDEPVRQPVTRLTSAAIGIGCAALFGLANSWLQTLDPTMRLVLLAAWPVAWGMYQVDKATRHETFVLEETVEVQGGES